MYRYVKTNNLNTCIFMFIAYVLYIVSQLGKTVHNFTIFLHSSYLALLRMCTFGHYLST